MQKRELIKVFFPDIPKEITKIFTNSDIEKILEEYKDNISNSKLKKNLLYFQNFNPKDEENINNWRIDMLLCDVKKCLELINLIPQIVYNNKTTKIYDINDIIKLILFGLELDYTNEKIQNLFFVETNNIQEIVQFEKKLFEEKEKSIIKSLFFSLSKIHQAVISKRNILNKIKMLNKIGNNNNNPFHFINKLFKYYYSFLNLLKSIKKDQYGKEIKEVNEFINKTKSKSFFSSHFFGMKQKKFLILP